MAKITEEEHEIYNEKISLYLAEAKRILEQEQANEAMLRQKKFGYAIKQLETADSMLNLASNYIVINGISLSVLGQKNEEALNEARKALYKSIIYLEGIVTNFIDSPFSEYEQELSLIESISPAQRFRLLRKAGLSIQLLENAYGDNTKWKWTFVELEGRYAAVAKNMLNLRDYFINSDLRSPNYEATVMHLRLVRKLLTQAADRFREKYELSTNRADDFIMAINFLSALIRIDTLTGDQDEVVTAKKKLTTWKNKLTSDMGKQETAYGSKG